MRRVIRIIADLALSLGALVGVACLIAAVGAVAFGVHPLIFRSGSMAPTIPTGSLAFARDVPAADIRVGDVVSVPWHDSRVTHRVVKVFHRDGSATLKLRGDANDAPDADLYQVSSAPRVWFSVPVLGRAVAWLSRTPGVFVLAGYAALLLTIVMRRLGPGGGGGPREEERVRTAQQRGRRRSGKRRATRRVRLLSVGVTGLAVGAVTASPTWAAWGDTGTVSGGALGTYTVPTTTLNCGTLGVLAVTFNWTAVPNATNYTLHYGNQTITTTNTSATITAAISGGTAWVNVNRNFGSTTWTSANSNTRSFTVAVVSLCG